MPKDIPAIQTEPSPESVLTLSSGRSGSCPGCGQPFQPRRPNQHYCSGKCRVEFFHAKRSAQQRDRDATVRLLLRTIMESAQEAMTVMRPDDAREEPRR